jgi:predicted metal-dependent phosphotriesterase family hydrolase
MTFIRTVTGDIGPADLGVTFAAEHTALRHVDNVVDRGYHRELVATGAFVEYDGSFRWGDGPNGTLKLLRRLADDGPLDHALRGIYAARQG